MTAPPEARDLCIGVDIGGTFTDVVVTAGIDVLRAKALTTHDDTSRGVLAACSLVAGDAGWTLEEMLRGAVRFGLGTTAVTNAIAERHGARVGLVTSKGHEDTIPLARSSGVTVDGWTQRPPALVPRERIVGVDERIDRNGTVLRPLDRDEVIAAARWLVDTHEVEAIAVSFLWSLRNAAHEDMAVEAIRTTFPDLVVTSGAAFSPIIREYERTNLALLNAFTAGAVTTLGLLEERLHAMGLGAPLLVVHSAGGVTTVREAALSPVVLAQSGPAAGVAGATEVGDVAGFGELITCDMGGTSFDVSAVLGGAATRTDRGPLMGFWTALPRVDIESIGAGGGSIGWVDALGILRVGPQSAGSTPGPACYGLGGTAATITDALVVLGYIEPTRFLGGAMKLDAGAALEACTALGERIDLSPTDVAWGIREIALQGMVQAVHARLADRGVAAGDSAVVSYGGCGGLFTGDIARAIGVPRVLFPEIASVLSAFGANTTDIRRERTASFSLLLPTDPGDLAAAAERLRVLVDGDLAADLVAPEHRTVRFEAGVKFKGQPHELLLPIATPDIDTAALEQLEADFYDRYARRYGPAAVSSRIPVEVVTLRAVGTGRTARATLHGARFTRSHDLVGGPAAASRPVTLRQGEGPVDVPTFWLHDLDSGGEVTGPALLDGSDTTLWIPDGATGVVTPERTLSLSVGRAPSGGTA